MNRPKGDDDNDDDNDNDNDNDNASEDELVRKNTRMNAAIGTKPYDSETESGDDSDVQSKTDDDDDGDDASTVTTIVDSDTNTDASDNTDTDTDAEGGADADADIPTPAMIAKKTATAASGAAAKKKPTTKRVVKGKATLQDITTLQQSYDDVELNDDGDDGTDLDDDDDESDDGTNYLRKFDSEMRENYITTHHHEMMQLNASEVDALVRVVRNADGVIVDPLHKTMPFLTKYEKTRILGQRAKQLNQGAQPVIPVDKKIIDGYLIAQLELQQKALPFIIRRPLPGGKSEYWRLADLELI
uniref:RNA polymerase Rpb6 n=1 Tax=viral metagenome TaxID=1070528 RepID=A0A6C0LZH5_9ZZZZ